jgi:hypothetical protein
MPSFRAADAFIERLITDRTFFFHKDIVASFITSSQEPAYGEQKLFSRSFAGGYQSEQPTYLHDIWTNPISKL